MFCLYGAKVKDVTPRFGSWRKWRHPEYERDVHRNKILEINLECSLFLTQKGSLGFILNTIKRYIFRKPVLNFTCSEKYTTLQRNVRDILDTAALETYTCISF